VTRLDDASVTVLEFVGLPGAGKSEIARRLPRALQARGYACAPRIPIGARGGTSRWSGAGRILTTNLPTLGSAARLALAGRPYYPGRLHHALRVPAWPRRWELARIEGLDVMVLEEGLVQNLWGVLLGGDASPDEADHTLRAVMARRPGVSFAFVHVDVDAETALRRIAGRGKPSKRIDRAPDPERRRLLTTHAPQLEELLRRASAIAQAPVLRVDGHRTTPLLLDDVIRFVESLPQACRLTACT
jgi:hypothetical protein